MLPAFIENCVDYRLDSLFLNARHWDCWA